MQPIRKLEGLEVLAAIDGEISVVGSYLTLSYEFLFKENDFTTKYEEERTKQGYAGKILIEGWLRVQSIESEMHYIAKQDQKDWEWWNSDVKVSKIVDHLFYCNICLFFTIISKCTKSFGLRLP